jgi:glutamate-ammonia-ligase adenylyltransferase
MPSKDSSKDSDNNANHLQSRFVSRWLNANPNRQKELENITHFPLSHGNFAEILQNYRAAGCSLNAAMRRTRNLLLSALIKADLTGAIGLNEVMTSISDFAEFCVQTHLFELNQDQEKLYGKPIGEETGEEQSLIVLGMGKLGGRELNVSSDIDLIFCYAEDGDTVCTSSEQKSLSNHEYFARLGKKLIAAISEITEDGFSFRVDMALRPNGNSGPLVASFAMLEDYFLIQGREWERYAWVKAKALTGNEQHIANLQKIIHPFVYRRYLDYGIIDSLRSMHQQIRAEVIRQETRHPERGGNVKLGRGGIREVEFLAQVFQLIRGGREAQLRDRSTLTTLDTLAEKNILDPSVIDELKKVYFYLRNLEHRIQYLDDAQTHTLPFKEDDQERIANMMGHSQFADLLAELEPQMHFVAEQFDAIFKDKTEGDCDTVNAENLNAIDGIDSLKEHLEQLNFHHADSASKRIINTWQSNRMRALPDANRQKMAALISSSLKLIAKQHDKHEETLGRMLDFLETIAKRSAYLSLLIEFPYTLERVLRMMSASDWAARFLSRHPILLDELLDENVLHQAPDWDAFSVQIQEQMEHHEGDTERQMEALRELHHAQLFRLLAQDLEGKVSVEHLADELSKLADVIVAACIKAAWKTIATRHCDQAQFAVIAYGKLGGKELSYASDLDVIFLYQDEHIDAPSNYAKLAQRFITWMTAPTSAGILYDIDVALRPDGASGLMVSSVTAFQRYQEQSAWLWEHQALSRARFCAGKEEIGSAFEDIREQILRKPREVTSLKNEVRTMRKKMRDANLNRSDLFDIKHDQGGMIDIEFIVQYLILQYTHAHPELCRNLGNIALLKRCGELSLISQELANNTANTYRKLRKLQHQIRLQGDGQVRVEQNEIASDVLASRALWQSLFTE